MKLLTKEIVNKMPQLYETEEQGINAPIIVKFFTPDSSWTWWAKEASAVDHDGNYHALRDVNYHDLQVFCRIGQSKSIQEIEFFGLVGGLDKELGYFHMSELRQIRGKFGLPIERDRHFSGKTIKDMM